MLFWFVFCIFPISAKYHEIYKQYILIFCRYCRLILFKECLKNRIVPFIIDESLKLYYYRGLSEWTRERGYLTDTCRSAQDRFKRWLDYYKILY